MGRGALFVWTLIALLLGASLFFGIGAERQRRSLQQADTSLATGEIVSLSSVIDGDTVLVTTEAGAPVTVRLLGVKSFPSARDKDVTAVHGQAAEADLKRALEGQPIRVLLHTPPKDAHGRTLATLFVGGRDVGLDLISRGLSLTYTVYPFPSMPLYLREQEIARADRRGLWADPAAVARADALAASWKRERQ